MSCSTKDSEQFACADPVWPWILQLLQWTTDQQSIHFYVIIKTSQLLRNWEKNKQAWLFMKPLKLTWLKRWKQHSQKETPI